MNTDDSWKLAVRADVLRLRARIIRAVRHFFVKRHFLEVETPVRIPAPAPESHIRPVPSDGWFLQTSPELCMKRLLAADYPRIFQICKCFRMPPSAGIALGLDRLVMLFADKSRIEEVVAFPPESL